VDGPWRKGIAYGLIDGMRYIIAKSFLCEFRSGVTWCDLAEIRLINAN